MYFPDDSRSGMISENDRITGRREASFVPNVLMKEPHLFGVSNMPRRTFKRLQKAKSFKSRVRKFWNTAAFLAKFGYLEKRRSKDPMRLRKGCVFISAFSGQDPLGS